MEDKNRISILACLIPVGSIYENKKQKGLSHFLEHLICLSSKKEKIVDDLTRFNVYFSAYTFEYFTLYKFYFLEQYTKEILKIAEDLILRPDFNESELINQKKLILEEIKISRDLYYKIYDDIKKTLFLEENIKTPIIGYYKNIKDFDLKTIKNWYSKFYQKAIFIKWSRAKISFLNQKRKINFSPPEISLLNFRKRKIVFKKQNNDAYVRVFILRNNFELKKIIALEILYHSLLSAESSFLYKELVKSGLAYKLYGFLSHYKGISILTIGAFSDNQEKICRKISSLTEEFLKRFNQRAFDLFKESYLNKFETEIANGDVIDFLANEIGVFGRFTKPGEILSYISKIKKEDIENIYSEIIRNSSWDFFYYR